MKATNRVLVGCLLLVAGCAHHRLVGYGKASVKVTRADAKELFEAFKTQAEKTISLPNLGEAKCAERSCRIGIEGDATVTEEGKIIGAKRVKGTLGFRAALASSLVKWIDRAYETDKPVHFTTADCEVLCDGKGCVLDFSCPARGEILGDVADAKPRFVQP
jgi:hypothetical protein